MCRFDPKNKSRFIDPCLRNLIEYLNGQGIETVACCCGHGTYPMSIIVRTGEPGVTMDICSGIMFRDRKRYYHRDADGVYFIPETVNA